MINIKRFALPLGPVLGLTLIGIMFLSAVLYYRAIKIQRFLEPALAISQPRIEFSQNIRRLLLKEFGTGEVAGVRLASRSIYVHELALSPEAHYIERSVRTVPQKLSAVFLSALKDENIRAHIDLILVIKRFPLTHDKPDSERMHQTQERASAILNSLYAAEPEIRKNFSSYFAAAAMPTDDLSMDTNWIEFRIIPGELLHIELLQKLHKYMR